MQPNRRRLLLGLLALLAYFATFAYATSCDDGRYTGKKLTSSSPICYNSTHANYPSESSAVTCCGTCTAGYSSVDGETCEICNAGTFSNPKAKPTAVFTCTTCPAKQYSDAGATQCSTCSSGSIVNGDQTGCIECVGGVVNDDQTACMCVAGEFGGRKGTSGNTCYEVGDPMAAPNGGKCCGQCPPGQVSIDGQTCELCPAGTYSDPTADPPVLTCTPCPVGLVSDPGASVCTSCAAGFGPRDDQTGCYECPGGWLNGDQTACICARGEFAGRATSGGTTCYESTEPTFLDEDCCGKCLPGYASTDTTTCAVCPAGTYSDSKASTPVPACEPCPAGQYSTAGASVCTSCPDGSIVNGDQTGCTVCPTGWWSNADQSACVCAVGHYKVGSKCIVCPAGLDCSQPGTTAESMTSLPQYFIIDGMVEACPQPNACTGNNECAEGYGGLMCNSCDDKYGWSESSLNQTCAYCDSSKIAIVVAIILGGVVIAAGIAIWVAITYSIKPKLYFIVPLTIFLSMAQVNFLVATKPSRYSDWFSDYFLLYCRYIASIRPTVLDLHCLFNKSNPHSIYMQGIFMLFLPPLIALLATVFVSKYLKNHPLQYRLHNKSYSTPDFKTLFATCASSVWFVLYPDAVWQAFAMWNCIDVGGHRVLYLDYGLQCTSGSYFAGTILLGIPLLLVMPGIHLMTFWFRGRQAAILVSQGYKDHMYLWYWLVVARKVAIAGIMAFVKYENHRLLGICMVILIALCFQGYFHPYQHDGHNLLEIIALGVLFAQFSFRIYFFSDLTTSDVRDGMSYSVAAFLCAFAVILIFFVIRYWIKHRIELEKLTREALENVSGDTEEDATQEDAGSDDDDEAEQDGHGPDGSKKGSVGSGQKEDSVGGGAGRDDSISRMSTSKNISTRRQSRVASKDSGNEVVEMPEIEMSKPKRKIVLHM